MTRFFGFVFTVLKWVFFIALGIELVAFAVISISNYIIYGHIREGSRAMYDAYTLFRSSEDVRPTRACPNIGATQRLVVWMFGGSTMRGSTDDNDKTIPSYLSAALNRADGPCYDITNFGENSFNSLLESKYLEKQLIENPQHPDLIVFYDGVNDSIYFAQHRSAYGHHGFRRVNALIESYHKNFFGVFKSINAAVLASFSKELLDKLNQIEFTIDPADQELQRHLDLTEKRYEFINKVAGCYNARFLLFWQPALWAETCDIAFDVRAQEQKEFINTDRFANMKNNFSTVYNALYERLQNKPYFIDMRNVLCARKALAYKPDGVHLTDLGREMVARQMFEVLHERSLLIR